MLKTNQNGGFDCPGCAWGESPDSGKVNFCENGAKAVNWEATNRLVDPEFFCQLQRFISLNANRLLVGIPRPYHAPNAIRCRVRPLCTCLLG